MSYNSGVNFGGGWGDFGISIGEGGPMANPLHSMDIFCNHTM